MGSGTLGQEGVGMCFAVGICRSFFGRSVVVSLYDVHVHGHYADHHVAGAGSDSLAKPSAVPHEDYTFGSGGRDC